MARSRSLLSSARRGVGAATLTIIVVGGAYDKGQKPPQRRMKLFEPRKVRTVGVGVVVAAVRVGVVVRILVAGRRTVVAAAVVVALQTKWSAMTLRSGE